MTLSQLRFRSRTPAPESDPAKEEEMRPLLAIDDAPVGRLAPRRRTILVPAILLALLATAAGCGEGSDRDDAPAASGPPTAGSAPPAPVLDTLARGLEVPWAMDFAPDGRIFVTERPGRIRVVGPEGLRAEPWAQVDVVSPDFRSEGGLMGIALSPDFQDTGHVFVVATFRTGDGLVNRVLRFTEREGRGVERTVIVDGLPGPVTGPAEERAIHTHVGGALTFGPDGHLIVTTGDATYPDRAQDPASLAGKVLRYASDGSIPPDNPLPGSPVYAVGLRNPTGVAWLPGDDLLATEHGPSELSWEPVSGWYGDEVNVIRPGRNYGWPAAVGESGNGEFVPALREWSPSIAPAGVGARVGPGDTDAVAFVASLRGQQLLRLEMTRDPSSPHGWTIDRSTPLLRGRVGRIRPVAVGPDGALYIGTSNRDSRGNPEAGDDHLFRVRNES